jgi:anti-anti-sigma factor
MQNALAQNPMPIEPEVMEISGRLDDGSAYMVEEDGLLCIESGARRMVLDCEKLSYITGAGMRAFLTLARALQEAGGHLAACNLQPQVADMFDACGYNAIIPIYRDLDEVFAVLAA